MQSTHSTQNPNSKVMRARSSVGRVARANDYGTFEGEFTEVVYRQNDSQGPICNGNVHDGVNTFHESGDPSFTGSNNHATFGKSVTAGNDVNMPTFHIHVNAPDSKAQRLETGYSLQQVFQPVLSFFQSVGRREALVHPLDGEVGTTANSFPIVVECTTGAESPTTAEPTYEGQDNADHDQDLGENKEPNDGREPSQADYILGLMNEPDLQSMRSQVTTNAEIYTRRMLHCNEGLPCWRPRPSGIAKQKGITPGDVGTFNLTHGFRKLFNLWEDEWAQSLGDLPSRDADIQSGYFPEGYTIQGGASSKICQSDDRSHVEQYEFQCNSSDSAVLACTMSADLEELESKQVVALERFLIQHAGVIYQKASHELSLGENDSLYIVTGCIKGDGWALAASQEAGTGETLRLSKRFAEQNTTDKGKIYVWEDRGTAEARLWPNTVGEAAACQAKCHSLFLRGFKLAFSPTFCARVRDGKSSPLDGDSSPGNDREIKGSSDGNRDDHSTGGGRPGGGDDSGSGVSTSSSSTSSSSPSHSLTRAVHIAPFPHIIDTWSIHPCDYITSSLLNMTGADCALSHDDDWRLAKRVGSWDVNDAFKIIVSKRISVRNGVVYLLPKDELVPPGATRITHEAVSSSNYEPSFGLKHTTMDRDYLIEHPRPTTNSQGAACPNQARSQVSVTSNSATSVQIPTQRTKRKTKFDRMGRKPPKRMCDIQAMRILSHEDLWGVRLLPRGFDPTASTGPAASIIEFGRESQIDAEPSTLSHMPRGSLVPEDRGHPPDSLGEDYLRTREATSTWGETFSRTSVLDLESGSSWRGTQDWMDGDDYQMAAPPERLPFPTYQFPDNT